MNKKEALVLTTLSLAIFFFAFLLSGRIWFRIDMTRGKAYTIHEISRNLYREISDIVTVTYFVSPRLAISHPMPGQIADLLREYAAHSRGRIRFIQRDPLETGLARTIEELGIIPWHIQMAERSETTLAVVHSGILIEYLDRDAVIPIAFSLDTLEYDLNSRIRSLVKNDSREIGIIIGDTNKDWQDDYELLNHALLLSGFRPTLIERGEWIPVIIPAIFVLGGTEDMHEYYLRPIDNYIQMGGNVLFALNGVFVDPWDSFDAWIMEDAGLLAMLANYGIILQQALVLDRSAGILTFQIQGEAGTQVQTQRYPHWIAVHEQTANQSHPVSAKLEGVNLFWPSSLELFPPPGITAEIIFNSTSEAWLQTENFVTNPNNISQFEDELSETMGAKILSASLSGIFPSAFGNDTLHSSGRENFNFAAAPSRIIVIGDVNFAGNLMQATHSEERNLEFFIRSAEWLSGREDLLALRGREPPPGRLDKITDPARREAVMVFSQIVNVAFIPLCVITTGFIVCIRRSRRTN